MQKINDPWEGQGYRSLGAATHKWTPTANHQRSRRVVGRSGGLMRGKFPSYKNQRMIHWESQLERDAIFIFEYSPAIRSYQEQYPSIFYVFGDKTFRYTSDFELTFVDGSKLIVEVKPAAKLKRPEIREKLDRVKAHLLARGQRFRILTDIEIQKPQLQNNFRLIQRYRSPPLPQRDRRAIVEKLSTHPILTFELVAQLMGSSCAVWELIGHEIISANLRQPICETTTFKLNIEDAENADCYL